MPPSLLLEAHLQEACTTILELDGWRYIKMEPVSNRKWGKGFGEVGMPDALYLRYGPPETLRRNDHQPGTLAVLCEVMWIEWKRKGGRPKPHQLAWHDAERRKGALVLCAGIEFEATFDAFIAWYRSSGLLRRCGI